MNLQEIFIWYFEQKGVDNPERFLGVNGVNNENQVPSPVLTDTLSYKTDAVSEGNVNPENQLSQNLPPPQFDMNTLAMLLGIIRRVMAEKVKIQ